MRRPPVATDGPGNSSAAPDGAKKLIHKPTAQAARR